MPTVCRSRGMAGWIQGNIYIFGDGCFRDHRSTRSCGGMLDVSYDFLMNFVHRPNVRVWWYAGHLFGDGLI